MINKLSLFNRLSFKVASAVISILFIGAGIVIFYYINNQNKIIINSKINVINEESEILQIAIKNNMLSGQAPIAVQLFKDFRRTGFVGDVKLFRENGEAAFSDSSTITIVNSNLGKVRFISDDNYFTKEKDTSKEFVQSVTEINNKTILDVDSDNKKIILYSPLINQPKCSVCHGSGHTIRGVVKIASPLNDTYNQIRTNTIVSAAIGILSLLLLAVFIVNYVNRSVINKIISIGNTADEVGKGNFTIKIAIRSKDEIGRLASQMNNMIDGLNERFKLTKFVSKATLSHVKDTEHVKLGGSKKIVTVMFTDIRSFTQYTENHKPEEVMSVLNEIMNMQVSVIENYGGDIDKFVGDEIMAVFESDDAVMRAMKASIEIRDKMKKLFSERVEKIALGIGINTGEVVSGNMGSDNRYDRTIIGDAVNLGARLCSAAGSNTIIISDYSYSAVKDFVRVKEYAPIMVKGKAQPVKIYVLKGIL